MVGLEEELQAGDANKVMNDILKYILDLKDTDVVPEVERHHRILCSHPGPPCPYILWLLRWTDWQNILRAAGRKKELTWRAKPFYIFQDSPVDIKKQRGDFADIKRKLRGRRKKLSTTTLQMQRET